MPNIDTMRDRRFLAKEDINGKEAIVTFKSFEQVNTALEGQSPKYKWAAYFNEFEKPLIFNNTNREAAALALGSRVTEQWLGKRVALFVDPMVSFQGKITGGVRVRGILDPNDKIPF